MTASEVAPAPQSRGAVLRQAWGSRDLRAVVIAYLIFSIGEWASYLTLLVWAFDEGGVRAASVIALVQLVPSALLAPVGASLLARMSRSRALLAGYVVQTLTYGACAAALIAQAPYVVVAVTAAAAALSVTLTRPVHHALLPEISNSTAALTVGNAATGFVEAVGVFLGPLLSGVLIVVIGPGGVVVVLAGLSVVASGLCLLVTRRPRVPLARHGVP